MRIVSAEADRFKLKVRYQDGRTEVLWRCRDGSSTPPLSAQEAVGMLRTDAVYAISTGFLRGVERGIESTIRTILGS